MRFRLKALVGRLKRGLASAGSGPETQEPAGRGPTGRPEADGQVGLPDADFRTVKIEYEPRMDGDPDPGEVVWAWVPFEEDPTQGKDRPIIIVGRTGRYLAGVALTSRDHQRPDSFALGKGPWDKEGRDSFAKLDRVLTIDPVRVRREGAVLDPGRFRALVEALGSLH